MAQGRGRGVGPSHLLQGDQAGAGCQARPGVLALPRGGWGVPGGAAALGHQQAWGVLALGCSGWLCGRAAGLLRALGVPTPPTTACICLLCLPQRPPSKVKVQSLLGVPARPLAPKRAEPDSGSAALGVVGSPVHKTRRAGRRPPSCPGRAPRCPGASSTLLVRLTEGTCACVRVCIHVAVRLCVLALGVCPRVWCVHL